ncbi:MAG: glycosyltransferase [Pseudomonadota bacterium]
MNETPKPLVSVVAPAYNEAGILEKNTRIVLEYFDSLADKYDWELIIVNDGSADDTRKIAESLAAEDPRIRFENHHSNRGAGEALKTGIAATRGDYVVTIDIDLSYSEDHIGRMVEELREHDATLVLASPYMKGGKLSAVPRLREVLSIWANRFLKIFARGNLSTITSMVRAYDGKFVRALALRSTGLDIMPETVYKTMILRGRIEQIPAHLDWSAQVAEGVQRRSSMQIARQIVRTVLAGFLFRPFMFFVVPGLLLLAFSAWVNIWMLIHFFDAFGDPAIVGSPGRASLAVAMAYQEHPHTFIVGLLSLMLAVQLVSLGILALQSKSYFEEVFHLGASIRNDLADASPTDVKDLLRELRERRGGS